MSHKPQLHGVLERGSLLQLLATTELVSVRNRADDIEDFIIRLQLVRSSVTAAALPALLNYGVNFTTIENFQTAKFEQWSDALNPLRPLPLMGVALQARGTEVAATIQRNATGGSPTLQLQAAVLPGVLQEYHKAAFSVPPGIPPGGDLEFFIPWFATDFKVFCDAPAGDEVEFFFPSGVVLQSVILTDVQASQWQPVHPLADRINYTNNSAAAKNVQIKFKCWG